MKNNHFLQMVIALVIITFLSIALSCNNYYKIAKTPMATTKPDSLIASKSQRYFILRVGENAYHMDNIIIANDKKTLTCKLDSLPEEHLLHLSNGRNGKLRFKLHKPENAVLTEIHIYSPYDKAAVAESTYTLQLNKIEKIQVIEKDKQRTTASYVLGGIGFAVGALVITAVIIAATKSSCPFVSAYNNGDITLQGEIYGGAIYPQLARNDYIPLKMSPLPNGNLQVRISNELKEKQYTDIAELMVVTHNKNVQMMVDENGRLYSVSNTNTPVSAAANNKDILPLLQQKNDDQFYSFNDTLLPKGNNQLNLTFNKPAEAKKAKLVLRLKNSYWMDYVYGKMTAGFGSFYTSFIQQQHSKPVADLKRWTKEQQIPLLVSLNTPNGLQQVANITTFGPLANRETVIPLDLTGLNSDKINVQLNCGFMFWELDYAAIDFTADLNYELAVLPPLKAIDENGKNVTKLISTMDGNYLLQPVPGNETDIEYKFSATKDKNKTQTFILHAKGYYEHVRNFKGMPNITFLEQFKKPDALSAYSKQLYNDALGNNMERLASNK